MSTRTGPLDPVKLYKIFRSLLDQKLTGQLVLTRGQLTKRVRIVQGAPVRVVSNARRESVLAGLQEHGFLHPADVEQVNQVRETHRLSAEDALLRLGLIDSLRLRAVESRMARRRLLEIFSWREGEYTFDEGPLRPEADDDPIDLVSVLIEAAASLTPQEDIARFCEAFRGQTARLTPWASTYGQAFDGAFGSPNARQALGIPLTIDELAAWAGDLERAHRQVFALVISGLAVFQRGGTTEPVARPLAEPAPVPPTATGSGPTVPRTVAIGAPPAPPSRTVAVAPPATSAGPPSRTVAVGPPATLAVPPRTVPGGLGSAPPPPRSGPGGPPPATPPPRNLQTHSVGLERPIPVAPRGSAAPSPSVAALRPTGGPGTSPASPPTEAARPSRTSAAARPPKPLDDKARHALAEVDRLADCIRRQTHYEILGVQKTAETSVIRAQFRKLARDFHADRFARYGLEATLLQRVQEVFMAINRAHEILSDPEKRKEYDLQLEMASRGQRLTPSVGGPDVGVIFRAETLVRDGVLLIRNGNPSAAKARFEEALVSTPGDIVARAGAAFAGFLVATAVGKNADADKCRVQLEEIVRDNEVRDEPFLYLGRIYRARGDATKAAALFKRALDVNPRCAEAASELRHLQRKEGGAEKNTGGLFGRKKA